MARVAIFIGVLSAPIPPRSISSLTVSIADPGEIQKQMFPRSTISVTDGDWRVGLCLKKYLLLKIPFENFVSISAAALDQQQI